MSKMDGVMRRGPHGIERTRKRNIASTVNWSYFTSSGHSPFLAILVPNPVPSLAVPFVLCHGSRSRSWPYVAPILQSRIGQTDGLFFHPSSCFVTSFIGFIHSIVIQESSDKTKASACERELSIRRQKGKRRDSIGTS